MCRTVCAVRTSSTPLAIGAYRAAIEECSMSPAGGGM